MSKKLVPHLFEIRQSRLFLYLLLITHILAIVACFSNGLAKDYQLIALFGVIISASFYWRDFKNFQPYTISHNEVIGWQVTKIKNDYQTIIILPTTVLTTHFIILHFRFQAGRKQALLIFNDALSNKDYQHLLVELKVSGLSKTT